jgi:hypothetical protein
MTIARTDPEAEVRRAALLAASRSGAGHLDSSSFRGDRDAV